MKVYVIAHASCFVESQVCADLKRDRAWRHLRRSDKGRELEIPHDWHHDFIQPALDAQVIGFVFAVGHRDEALLIVINHNGKSSGQTLNRPVTSV
jgi:hypothetical protein